MSKALARAPRQLQNVNNDQRLPGLFLLQTETGVFALGYVPDEMQDRFVIYVDDTGAFAIDSCSFCWERTYQLQYANETQIFNLKINRK